MPAVTESACEDYLDILHDAFDYVPKRALRFFLEEEEDRISSLVKEMGDVIQHPEAFEEDESRLLYYGIMILAALDREEGISLVKKIGQLSEERIDSLLGERFFDSFTLAIAELYKYKIKELKALIEDESSNPALRAASVQAMMILYGRKILSRTDVVSFFKGLLEKRKEKIPYLYDVIAGASFALHPEEMIEELRQAHKEGFIDSEQIQLSEIEETYSLSKEEVVESSTDMFDADLSDLIVHLDLAYKEADLPERNDLCPCGSSLKYKKCCM